MSDTKNHPISLTLRADQRAEFDHFLDHFPGCTQHAVLRACVALAMQAGAEDVRRHLGRRTVTG